MPFKTDRELEKLYEHDGTYKDRVSKLFALRELYRNALRAQDFEPSMEFLSALEFTAEGAKLIAAAINSFGCSENSAKFCVFLLMFHHDLLVDLEKTKIARILECLTDDIVNSRITYPWLFDHLLYDRAFESFAQKPKELSIKQTQLLVSGAPVGVFQVGHFVVGPLGALQSEQKRWFLPRLNLPLYHCEDQLCGEVHIADLAQPDVKNLNVTIGLRTVLEEEQGPMSEWRPFIRGLITDSFWYDDFSLSNLVWLLGDGFSECEIQAITDRIIANGKHNVRTRIPSKFHSLFAAPSSQIVRTLSKPTLLQIALLCSDASIAALIDGLIDSELIQIPSTEVRHLVAAAPVGSWAGAFPQCSDLGIRVVGRGQLSNPLARLKRLLLEVHKGEDAKAQLKWTLRQIPGPTLGEQLESLITKESPSKLLRQIVVSNISMLRSALSHLQAAHMVFPNTEAEESRFIEKLLWKLGFGKREFKSPVREFWPRLEQFQQVVSSPDHADAGWISSVRSAGVNLFVGLEQLLENALSFLCWVFLTDPLTDSHVYNAKKAKPLLPRELDGLIETERGPVTYDPGGRNTLFPLIVGFSAAAKRFAGLIAAQKEHQKAALFLAHYHGQSSLQSFPYKHDIYICDADPADVERIIALCNSTAAQLQQSKVFEIRNKLEHNNEELPSAKEMIRCAELLSETITGLEDCGLIPTIYALKELRIDEFGRTCVTSTDDRGRELKWQPSPALKGIKSLPRIEAPQIIVAGFKVPETNEPLRFSLEEDSEYSKMWEGYPKHGKVELLSSRVTQTSQPEPASIDTSAIAKQTVTLGKS